MSKWIAERNLLLSQKGSSNRSELIIRISTPYVVDQNAVNFPVGDGVSGCTIQFDGLTEISTEEVFGADHIQALQLAVNIDPILKRFSSKYDFFFPTGECYFETEEPE